MITLCFLNFQVAFRTWLFCTSWMTQQWQFLLSEDERICWNLKCEKAAKGRQVQYPLQASTVPWPSPGRGGQGWQRTQSLHHPGEGETAGKPSSQWHMVLLGFPQNQCQQEQFFHSSFCLWTGRTGYSRWLLSSCHSALSWRTEPLFHSSMWFPLLNLPGSPHLRFTSPYRERTLNNWVLFL